MQTLDWIEVVDRQVSGLNCVGVVCMWCVAWHGVHVAWSGVVCLWCGVGVA